MEHPGTSPHLSPAEARAILALSVSEDWKLFKQYLYRQEIIQATNCCQVKEDHRFFQGQTLIYMTLSRIEDKAKNILGGS